MAQAVSDERPSEQYLRQAGDDPEPIPGTIAELTQELEQISLPLLSDTDDPDTDTDTPIYPLGMQHHMRGPTNMMMPRRKMVNGGGPHGSGQIGMGPQMGGTTPAPNHQNATSNQGTPVGSPRTAPSPGPDAVMGSSDPMNQAGGMNMGMGGMMGMSQPPPPNSGMSVNSGGGGNNGAPGNGGNGAPGNAAGAGPGGGVGGGSNSGGPNSGISSGMNFLGMNPMAGMNGPVGTGIGGGMNSMNPPSSNGNNGDGGGGMGGMQDLVFSHESMNTLVNGLDPVMVFRPDEDVSFEREFELWFHPEGSLDLK